LDDIAGSLVVMLLMKGRVRLEYGPKDGFARHGRQTVHFGLGSAR